MSVADGTNAAAHHIQDRLDGLFGAWMEGAGPGGAVGVMLDGEPALHRCYGLANLEHAVPIGPATRFAIASVTKPIIATAMTILAERGAFCLDDPVGRHFPGLRAGRDATLRQLLDMTSGLRDAGELMRLRGVWFRYPRSHDDMLELLDRQTTLNFPTGERYIYTNVNFGLCGTLIERTTGKPLDDALRELVFGPVGMADTLVRDANTTVTPRLATGYIPAGETFEVGVWSFGTSGAGSLVSTIPDLLRLQGALLAGEIGGVAVTAALTTTGYLLDGTPLRYGLGLDTRIYRGVKVLSHGGSLPGYKAMFALVPELRAGFVLLANRDDADPTRRYREILDVLLDDRVIAPPPLLVAGEDAARRLAGRWLDHRSGELLVIEAGDDGLLQADKLGHALLLQPDGERRWRYDFGHFPVTMEERDDGLALYFGGERCHFERLGAPPEELPLQDYAGTYASDDLAAEHEVWLEGDRLRVRQGMACHGASTFTLQPLAADLFYLEGGRPGWTYKAAVRFERNANGAVGAMLVSTDRLKDMRLRRTADASGALAPSRDPAT